MMQRYIYNKRINNAPIRRRLDRRFVRWVIAAAFVGSAVAFGYVYSARCHFEAMALGYETQQKRLEVEAREEQQHKLELERQRELAPDKLEKRARGIGLRDPQFVGAAVDVKLTQPRPLVR